MNTKQIDYFLDESFVRNFFELNLSNLNLSDFRILNCQTNLLKRRKSKAAIEFKLHLRYKRNDNSQHNHHRSNSSISKSIVGKWRSDGRGKEVFDLLQEIWTKGFARDDGNNYLKIYEPIAYFPDHNLMVTSKAKGVRLKELIIKCNYDHQTAQLIKTCITRAAKWLARLHSLPLPINSNNRVLLSIENEEKKFNVWSKHLTDLYPDFARRVNRILSQILQMEKSVINRRNFVLIHGDFHTGNIFVDDEHNLTVIDFEQSCIFEPTFDLAYFITKLLSIKRKYKLLSLNTDELEKLFLDRYHYYYRAAEVVSRAEAARASLERLATFKARSCLEHLHSRYCQHLHSRNWTYYSPHKPDSIDFEYWLNKAEQSIILFNEI